MVRRLSSLEELYGVFGDLFPERMLGVTKEGANSRRRSLPAVVTFWAFVSQVLSPKSSCREVVRKVEAWWRWQRLHAASAVSASAYCQARARLDLDTLRLIRRHLSWALERPALAEERWLQGRPVKIVDGTNLSMPDNPANQRQWPQPSGQQVGCGFPMMKLVGLFSLSSGALLEEATGNQHVHESRLFQQLWERLERGDVILEDRGFCSYGAMAALLARGVDTVARLHHARKADLRSGRALGPEDRLLRCCANQNHSGLGRAALPKPGNDPQRSPSSLDCLQPDPSPDATRRAQPPRALGSHQFQRQPRYRAPLGGRHSCQHREAT
ncbi:MAG: IS4 family transposase [Chthoniobacterales bacterium]